MFSCVAVLYPVVIADLIWPAMFLENRMLSVWVISAGFLMEYFFVRGATSLNNWRAFLANLSMNAASALLGIFLIPLAGIIWEVFPGLIFYKWLKMGTFNPITWTATYILAVLINSLLELTVLIILFEQSFEQRLFWWLCLANALSVGVAMGSFIFYPLRHQRYFRWQRKQSEQAD